MSRIKQPISDRSMLIWALVGIFVLTTGYYILSYRQHVINPSDTTIPNFSQLLGGLDQVTNSKFDPIDQKESYTFFDRITHTKLWQDSTATYLRLFLGLSFGCVVSIFFGVLMGCYPSIEGFLLPVVSFLSKVPGTAMLAVFFVVVGTGETMFVAMLSFGVIPTLSMAIYLSAKHDLHEEEIFKAYTLGANNYEVICNIVFPQILPKVLESVRLQIGPAMVALIAAEMLVGQVGMGYQIRMQQRMLNMSIVYDYIMILGFTGFFMDRAMLSLRRWMCPWYSRFR